MSVTVDRPFPRSYERFAAAEAVTPLGTQTLSKSPTQFVQGAVPQMAQRARGAHFWDLDGNEWVDWPAALGPIVLGHGDPGVDAAIRAQLDDGITFSLPHPLEAEVAERIVAMVPGVEAVRFAKSGSEADSAAIRAARALTGRDLVLVGGYHGWHDWYIGSTARDLGVPAAVQALTVPFAYGDLDALAAALGAHQGQVAAVILEPSGGATPPPGYLAGVVELAHAHGALAIFDEVITGFRLGPGGARTRYGVEPDFSTYGKALGNGMPVSAVAGRWEHMHIFERIFVSGTHGGETLSLAAARATLDALADGRVFTHLHRLGSLLLDGIQSRIDAHGVAGLVTVGGEPERPVLGFPGPDELVHKSWTQQCLAEAGHLFNGAMFICAATSDADVQGALDAFDTAFAGLASAQGAALAARLVGDPVQPVFRKV